MSEETIQDVMLGAVRKANSKLDAYRLFTAKLRAETKQCQTDDCELSHCKTCGGHMLGAYLEYGARCDSCAMAIQQWEEDQAKYGG